MADGSEIRKRRVLLRELTVGGVTALNVTASIGGPGSPSLLGQSFRPNLRPGRSTTSATSWS